MTVLLAIFALAMLVWALVYARQGSLMLGGALFVALSYIFTNNFWKMGFGPLSLNCGRALLVGLVLLLAWRWRQGRIERRPLTGSDWLGALLIAYLTARFMFTPELVGEPSSVSPAWRLIAGFFMSAVLYTVMRSAELTQRSWKMLLGCLSVLGVYLAVTGVAEVHGQWWAVFPRFIADPTLGTHFGRARGPALMSASLGVFLAVCFWSAWFLWSRVERSGKMLLLGAMAGMVWALYFTYTRSTWLGLAGGLAVIPLLHLPRSWRPLLLVGMLLVGTVGMMTVGGNLLHLGRQDSDASPSHSVYQRASFFYVSMQMIRDNPLTGCGFGRFYDRKFPYLSDRRQQIEIESIRKLDHHNTFLSVLVETGAIGFVLFVGLLLAWTRAAWRLAHDTSAECWIRAHGLFA
ncbi:MAG: O-antigen ligase family protein, partial [Pirellulales bacterium]|nr:O-antigen ligase family protein [Pirellulales bacterium]